MKFKAVGFVVATLGLASSAIWAQSEVTTGAAGVNAPAAPVTIAPSVAMGARTDIQKVVNSGTKASTTFGPYVTPGFALTYKSSNLTITASYAVEISGARGFGGAAKTISDNAYFDNNPVLVISGGVNPNWKANLLLDTHFKYYNQQTTENKTEVFLNPDIERVISPNLSISAGYVLHRLVNVDNILSAKADEKAGVLAASSLGQVGQEKANTLHAAVVTMKNTIGEQKVTTYIRAGRRIANTANDTAYSYRLQTEWAVQSPIKALTGALRYRLNVEDQKGAELSYYNLGRVVASYAVNSNWSVDLANEITLAQNTQAGKKAALENENYIGATFKF